MKVHSLIGKRVKETPKDAVTASHVFLMRGGYVKPFSTGIYGLNPIAKRIAMKIEAIIREEMNRIEGQEVLMPVVLSRELWEESGRYQSVGTELLRFKDRNQKDMLLGMTHEEAIVHMVRNDITSYKQLPVMGYQIQTKYRDEARPRAGLIRVREFTMKDAYSFHETQECLEKYYARAHEAYERIFKRVGLPQVVSIESDTGMMGGKVSHEFMAVSEAGEDTIFLSQDGQYKANREIARARLHYLQEPPNPLEKVSTPGQKTIEDVAGFLKVPTSRTGKAVFYFSDSFADSGRSGLIFAMIRGDIEVNETKLKNALQTSTLRFANDAEITAGGSVPGFASPLGLDPKRVQLVLDHSIAQSSNLVVGANERDAHYLGFNYPRDLQSIAGQILVTDIATAREGDPDPITGNPLSMKRGIEVGNIFQLGTKYSESMRCDFLDRNGKARPMIMGCYGIGVGRTLAAVIEQSHDSYGPIWPISIAPFQVQICALRADDPQVRQTADKLYQELITLGVEVLLDDRNEKPGVLFAEADLFGIPFRLVVSPKTLAEGKIEFKRRDGQESGHLDLGSAVTQILDRVQKEQRLYRF